MAAHKATIVDTGVQPTDSVEETILNEEKAIQILERKTQEFGLRNILA